MSRVRFLFVLACLLLLIAAGCQPAAPEVGADPTDQMAEQPATAAPAETAVPASPTPAPMGETLVPTATRPAASPTPAAMDETAVPTATSTPLAPATATVTTTALLPGGEIFTIFDAAQPVVEHGEPGNWDGQFTDPGAVVYHDGAFHMFRNGFVGWPAPVGIAYAVSGDGMEWSEPSLEPVIEPDEMEQVPYTALASSALVEEDGSWVLYFYTWDSSLGATAATSRIIRATAPAPEGPWTLDAEPVLVPGSEGEWDSLALRAPSVVKVDGDYLMFYAGYTRQGMSIGMATSADGVTWEKYDDPLTTEAPYAESDPVFEASEDGWDDGYVYQPRVVATPEGLFMLYSSSDSVNGANARLGYAYSEDGLEWARSEESVMEPGQFEGGLAIWFTEMVYQEGTTYLFLEIGTGGETEIYLATREEPLPRP